MGRQIFGSDTSLAGLGIGITVEVANLEENCQQTKYYLELGAEC